MGIYWMTQGTQTGALWQSRSVEQGGRWEGGSEGGDMGITMADSLCVTENHKILQSNYPSVKKKTVRILWKTDTSSNFLFQYLLFSHTPFQPYCLNVVFTWEVLGKWKSYLI